MSRRNQVLGYRADCRENFEKGLTVTVLCKALSQDGGDEFLYRIRLRKRGMAKSRPII